MDSKRAMRMQRRNPEELDMDKFEVFIDELHRGIADCLENGTPYTCSVDTEEGRSVRIDVYNPKDGDVLVNLHKRLKNAIDAEIVVKKP